MSSASASIIPAEPDQAQPEYVLHLLPEVLFLVSVVVNVAFATFLAKRFASNSHDVAQIALKKSEAFQVTTDTPSLPEAKQQEVTKHSRCVAEFLHQLSSKCMPAASRLVLGMGKIGMIPSPSFYRSLLQHMSRLGAPRDLFDKLVLDMEEQNCHKDSQMECYRIQYLARTDGAQVGLDAFKKFLEAGFQPNLRTFECLMVACLKEKMHEPLKQLFDDLEDIPLLPSPVVYSSLIASYGQTGAVGCSLAALDQMKEEFALDPDSLQLGYGSALHALARNHRMGKVDTLFDEFVDRGLKLDARLVGILLVAAVQTESMAFVKKLIKRARVDQVEDLMGTVKSFLEPLKHRPGSETLLSMVWAVLRSPQ